MEAINTQTSSPDTTESFTQRYTNKLYEVAEAALSENVGDDEQAAKLQSIIGMVHTLVVDGRTQELDNALRAFFPEFYNDMRA